MADGVFIVERQVLLAVVFIFVRPRFPRIIVECIPIHRRIGFGSNPSFRVDDIEEHASDKHGVNALLINGLDS